MELLDVRHMVLLHLPLEDAPHVLNRVQVGRHTWPLHHHHLQLHQQGSCHLGGVFGVVVMLENSFWREGIIFYFRMSQYMLESMFPSMNCSSPLPAVVMQPQTMMLPPLGMGIDKNLTIPIPLSILLIDPIPYRFSYRFSLGEGISTNLFVCINSL